MEFPHVRRDEVKILKVGSLHSQILQKHRLSALSKFRSGRIRILICTDVAARGLDIQHVSFLKLQKLYSISPPQLASFLGRSCYKP